MTESSQANAMMVSGDTLLVAVTKAFNAILALSYSFPADESGDITARFQATAGTVPELIVRLLDAVIASGEDFEASVARVLIDGIRPIESGYRGWGVATLGARLRADQGIRRIAGVPAVTEAHGGVSISLLLELET